MSVARLSAEVTARLRTVARAAFYLDFDGTLAPIVERPEDAVLPEHVRTTLSLLASDPRFTLAIISGRAMSDLQRRVGIAGLVYAGNHGLEIGGPGFSFQVQESAVARERIRWVASELSASLLSIPEAQLEDKGLTLSVHFRRVEASLRDDVVAVVRRAVPDDDRLLLLRDGKMVIEIRPRVNWTKGQAVLWIRAKLNLQSAFEVYIGDDCTDEDAFQALPDAFTIRVGAGPATAARYHLADTQEVADLLQCVLDEKDLYGDPG